MLFPLRILGGYCPDGGDVQQTNRSSWPAGHSCRITRLAHGSLQDERVTALATPKLVRRHDDRLRRPPNRHVLVPTNDVRWIARRLPVHLKGRQCAQQLAHSHARFEFRQRHPDAEMNPLTEREVPTSVTVENQLIWTVELSWISVSRREKSVAPSTLSLIRRRAATRAWW